jgi:hypothetical protein
VEKYTPGKETENSGEFAATTSMHTPEKTPLVIVRALWANTRRWLELRETQQECRHHLHQNDTDPHT